MDRLNGDRLRSRGFRVSPDDIAVILREFDVVVAWE
jgi:hypothetical protein